MSSQIATVTSPETLSLSEDAQTALGLHIGSRFAITLSEGRITFEPINQAGSSHLQDTEAAPQVIKEPYQREVRRLPEEEATRIISELRGMFRGEPSLEDEYFRDRDKDKW
jgi:hypothetical protein